MSDLTQRLKNAIEDYEVNVREKGGLYGTSLLHDALYKIQQLEAQLAEAHERRQDDIEKAHYAGQFSAGCQSPSTHAAMAYYYGLIDRERTPQTID